RFEIVKPEKNTPAYSKSFGFLNSGHALLQSSFSVRLCCAEMAGAKDDGPAIGIDLGTTYSCVAVWRPSHNRVEVIPNDQGNLTTPSCVAFTDTCRLIGDSAMNQAAMNSVNTVFGKN
uniref:Uncharacterized protein n=1 Tax=Aegilops tauschii subsp. strangulata TaxID=200361 RepID=A0A453IDE8_AEGTS